MKQQKPKGLTIIHSIFLLLIIVFAVFVGFEATKVGREQLAEDFRDDPEWREAIEKLERCEFGRKVNETINYDLIEHHNMSCKEIKFTIDNWVKEISYETEYAGGGLFSSRYETVEKYHGVGQVQLIRYKNSYSYPEGCGGSASSQGIYLEKDFVEYYRLNCMGGFR